MSEQCWLLEIMLVISHGCLGFFTIRAMMKGTQATPTVTSAKRGRYRNQATPTTNTAREKLSAAQKSEVAMETRSLTNGIQSTG